MHSKRDISFASDLWISPATRADWPYFARWHYRSHHIGLVRFMTLLWHRDAPIGICVFVSPPKSLALRNRHFGRSGRWDGLTMRTLSTQLVTLQRVVLHPTYRGAGIAAPFVRRSCELCPFPWIETLTQMGHIHPFFEKAGFRRIGITAPHDHSRAGHAKLFKARRATGRPLLTPETTSKSRHARPVYYVFDNRKKS